MKNETLQGLSHSYKTDLRAGKICNADAVLLLLNAHGGVATSRNLRSELRQWRPGLSFGYLFQFYVEGGGGYGFAGDSWHSETTRVWHNPTWGDGGNNKGHHSDRRTYYYRSGRGIYSITAEGYRRLEELAVQTQAAA